MGLRAQSPASLKGHSLPSCYLYSSSSGGGVPSQTGGDLELALCIYVNARGCQSWMITFDVVVDSTMVNRLTVPKGTSLASIYELPPSFLEILEVRDSRNL